jgi:3-oxoacyl-[acyl-carrier protein] reductase
MTALPSSIDLTGRVALVTGGIAGIGKGIALELGRRGASVVITYTSSNKSEIADKTVKELKELRGGVEAVSIRADLREPAAHQYIVDETLKELGTDHIDILGNMNHTEERTPC